MQNPPRPPRSTAVWVILAALLAAPACKQEPAAPSGGSGGATSGNAAKVAKAAARAAAKAAATPLAAPAPDTRVFAAQLPAAKACTLGPRPHLIFSSRFEAGTFAKWSFKWLRKKSSASIVKKPVRCGKGALRMTLGRKDPMYSKGKRSELQVPTGFSLRRGYWFGFSVFVPADWKEDFEGEVVAQWFNPPDKHLGEKGRSPALALRINKKKWHVTNRWDPRPLTPKNGGHKRTLFKTRYERGRWTDWVFYTRFSWQDDGRIVVYKDGERVVDLKGPNSYNDQQGPIFKMGVYKAPWNDPDAPSNVAFRELFFDEVRVADEAGGAAAVRP